MKKILLIASLLFLNMAIVVAQSNIIKTIQPFPYQKSNEATDALDEMSKWKSSTWKKFYRLLDDSNYKTKATYALHAYINKMANSPERINLEKSLSQQKEKAKTAYAKIALQDELNLLTAPEIVNARNNSLPTILVPNVLVQNKKDGVEQLLELESQMTTAKNPIEQRRVIAAVAKIPSMKSFEFCSRFLDNSNINQEAALALTRLALSENLKGREIKATLEKAMPLISGVDSAILTTLLKTYLEKEEGFVNLFDGTQLDAWMGNFEGYKINENAIEVVPNNGSGGNLYTKEEFEDFIFRFEFQLTPGANNGIGIHAPLSGDAAYEGMEIQILDNEAPIYKDLQPYQYHGSVYGIAPAKRGYLLPTGEWNKEEIIIKGSFVKVTLNGTVINEVDLKKATENGTMDHKAHPGLERKNGHIGFLGHGDVVRFRNVRIKRI